MLASIAPRNGSGPPVDAHVVDNTDGSYSCSYMPVTASDNCHIAVTVNGMHVNGSPFFAQARTHWREGEGVRRLMAVERVWRGLVAVAGGGWEEWWRSGEVGGGDGSGVRWVAGRGAGACMVVVGDGLCAIGGRDVMCGGVW